MINIKKIEVLMYEMTITADDMCELWEIMNTINRGDSIGTGVIKSAEKFFNKLEDIRPGGGFEQRKYVK